MVELSDSEKIEDMCNRLNRIPECDGRTDRHLATAVCAMHTRRAVKSGKSAARPAQ